MLITMQDFDYDRNILFVKKLRISFRYRLDKSYIYGKEKHHLHKYNEQL